MLNIRCGTPALAGEKSPISSGFAKTRMGSVMIAFRSGVTMGGHNTPRSSSNAPFDPGTPSARLYLSEPKSLGFAKRTASSSTFPTVCNFSLNIFSSFVSAAFAPGFEPDNSGNFRELSNPRLE